VRIGFYVEGRYFASRGAQAMAYAQYVSETAKRPVMVKFFGPVLGWQTYGQVDSGVRP
jgi:hypothetical protein